MLFKWMDNNLLDRTNFKWLLLGREFYHEIAPLSFQILTAFAQKT